MSTKSPAATSRTPVCECLAEAGTKKATKPGNGCEPTTLSTAILSGSGVSSAKTLESRLSANSPPMWRQ